MKKLLFILLIMPIFALSQTLISDVSFEDTTECPNSNSINLKSWYRPSLATSDAFCECWTPDSLFLSPPYQTRNSKSGNCFVGGILFYENLNYREYIESKLLFRLDSGIKYCANLYVLFSLNSNFALSNIQLGFREDSIIQQNGDILKVDTFYNFTNSIQEDSINWIKLELSFVATGSENYVSVGNFDSLSRINYKSYNSTTSPPFLIPMAYYFFDLITLEKCIEPGEPPFQHFTIYPNPSNGNSIYIDKYADTTAQITLYNALGQQVGVRHLPAGAYNGAVFEQLASGVYVVVYVTATGYREEKKVVVVK